MSRIIDRLYKDPSFDLSEEGDELLEYLRRQTKENLRLIRNTIFARKSYKFDDQQLVKYFLSKFPSYKPDTKAIEMTRTDERNLRYIKEVEEYAYFRDAAG